VRHQTIKRDTTINIQQVETAVCFKIASDKTDSALQQPNLTRATNKTYLSMQTVH